MDQRIARAIDHLYAHWRDQPGLEELAAVAGLAPHHFQRRFKAHCGLTPKRFLQALTLEQAKGALDDGASVLDAAFDVGLSGPGRLHDLFVAAEAVTPGGFKAKGGGLELTVGRHATPFGPVVVALSERGLAWLGLTEADPILAVAEDYPLARLRRDDARTAPVAEAAFAWARGEVLPLRLDLRGTAFQLQVWRALLSLPAGATTTYARLARDLDRPRAMRAVGGAVGANRVAVVIPCHRVIRAGGALGGYRWGLDAKTRLLRDEAAGLSGDAAA